MPRCPNPSAQRSARDLDQPSHCCLGYPHARTARAMAGAPGVLGKDPPGYLGAPVRLQACLTTADERSASWQTVGQRAARSTFTRLALAFPYERAYAVQG